MTYGLAELFRNFVGFRTPGSILRKDEFWAVQNISFDLKRGDILGLVGVNGSGKSTLLRLLTGILPPDTGQIVVKGRVGALIAVGAGFHPHMTGRENIYLNGTLLGMTRREIDEKVQDIVDFAEIDEFLDAPVSTYSSGMRVRLGFAIAIQIKPDVLFVDEVLAVGDLGFKLKCYNAIARLVENAAVIFVSHDLPQVERISNRIGIMHAGRLEYLGDKVVEGLELYYRKFSDRLQVRTYLGKGNVKIQNLRLLDKNDTEVTEIAYLDPLTIQLDLLMDEIIGEFVVNITFVDINQTLIAGCNSLYAGKVFQNRNGRIRITCRLRELHMSPGVYHLNIAIVDSRLMEKYLLVRGVKELKIKGDFMGAARIQVPSDWIFQDGI